jgi:hypothetical protein
VNAITLKQAAILFVRFFGFTLLFYAVLGIFDLPGYWIRSTFGHGSHHFTGDWLDRSYDIYFAMYLVREAIHIVVGMYLIGQPGKLAEILQKRIGE